METEKENKNSDLSLQFILPSTMIKYSNFKSFLEEQPKLLSKNDLFLEQLLGSKLAVSTLNISMLTMTNTANFTSWKVPETWEGIFNSDTGKYEINRAFQKLQMIAHQGYTIFPNENEIFKAFELCKRTNLKVVIIGQDPYNEIDPNIGLPMANGLAFSGRKGGKKPSQLVNIFKEISNTFPGIPLEHYDLTNWAEQGVLLLNSCLTVNQGCPESHMKGESKIWNYFIEYVIKTISEEQPGVIFCLWGAKAKVFANGSTAIISKNKSIILEAGHKFLECGHFAMIYHIIEKQNQDIYTKNIALAKEGKEQLPYKQQINWALIN